MTIADAYFITVYIFTVFGIVGFMASIMVEIFFYHEKQEKKKARLAATREGRLVKQNQDYFKRYFGESQERGNKNVS